MNKVAIYHGGGMCAGGGGGGVSGGAVYPHGEVVLAYAATVNVNLALGDVFHLVLTAVACTIANPTNAIAGQRFCFRFVQPATANGLVNWDTKYKFSVSLPIPVLTASANVWDYCAFVYNAQNDSYDYIGEVTNF